MAMSEYDSALAWQLVCSTFILSPFLLSQVVPIYIVCIISIKSCHVKSVHCLLHHGKKIIHKYVKSVLLISMLLFHKKTLIEHYVHSPKTIPPPLLLCHGEMVHDDACAIIESSCSLFLVSTFRLDLCFGTGFRSFVRYVLFPLAALWKFSPSGKLAIVYLPLFRSA